MHKRRVVRIAGLVVLGFLAIPLVAGAALTATFAGWTSVAVAVIFWIAFVAIGLLVARFAFRNFGPVRDLISSTSQLADGDYSARVSAETSPAMRPLVDSFNEMAERLELSDELRRRLLADVGHELRTPLTIVRGELEAMADGVREINRDELRLLLDDVADMERLLDDLRTLSTTEAGMVNLEKEPTDLGELAEDVTGRFAAQASERGVTLRTMTATPVWASIDPDRIGQVVSNVVANALRAVSTGDEVVVSVTQSVEREGAPAGMVEIQDNGPGISPERIDAVFDRFQKGADSNGSGLGLTISRDLVEAHGGTIEITSQVGTGTKVTVTLPT